MNKELFSVHKRISYVNVLFSEALELHKKHANNLPCTLHWKSIRAEMAIDEIWDDTLDRVFRGGATIETKQLEK